MTTLPAFRVTYTDGTSYVTSAAAGITLSEFEKYITQAPHFSEEYSHEKQDFVEVRRYVGKVEQVQ